MNVITCPGARFRRLLDSQYPRNISDTHLDYLWMASEDPEQRRSLEILMSQRLRLACPDLEEFAQAAATQVVFHEYSAMMGSLWISDLSAKESVQGGRAAFNVAKVHLDCGNDTKMMVGGERGNGTKRYVL